MLNMLVSAFTDHRYSIHNPGDWKEKVYTTLEFIANKELLKLLWFVPHVYKKPVGSP